MVYQASHAVKIPVIGMGGIATADDAIEFLLAGASAIAIGAMNFANPYTTIEVIEGIEAYMKNTILTISTKSLAAYDSMHTSSRIHIHLQ